MKKLLMNFFQLPQKKTAKTAKERLQIVVSHQRANETNVEFLPMLRKELLDVICKYMTIDLEQINVNLQKEGNCSILELNVTIPEPVFKCKAQNNKINSTPKIKNKAVTNSEKLVTLTTADN